MIKLQLLEAWDLEKHLFPNLAISLMLIHQLPIYTVKIEMFILVQKILPEYFFSFPVKKKQLIRAIFKNKDNLQKISSIVHPAVEKI